MRFVGRRLPDILIGILIVVLVLGLGSLLLTQRNRSAVVPNELPPTSSANIPAAPGSQTTDTQALTPPDTTQPEVQPNIVQPAPSQPIATAPETTTPAETPDPNTTSTNTANTDTTAVTTATPAGTPETSGTTQLGGDQASTTSTPTPTTTAPTNTTPSTPAPTAQPTTAQTTPPATTNTTTNSTTATLPSQPETPPATPPTKATSGPVPTNTVQAPVTPQPDTSKPPVTTKPVPAPTPINTTPATPVTTANTSVPASPNTNTPAVTFAPNGNAPSITVPAQNSTQNNANDTVAPRSSGAVATSENRTPLRRDYRISLGTFGSVAEANAKTAAVKALGYTVYPIDLGSQVVAQIGPFADSAAANAALSDIGRAYGGAVLYAPRSSATESASSALTTPTAPSGSASSSAPSSASTSTATTPAQAPAPTGPVYLQVGAFDLQESAQRLVGMLSDIGYNPSVQAPEGRKVTVLIGPFSGNAVLRAENKLNDNGFDHFRVR